MSNRPLVGDPKIQDNLAPRPSGQLPGVVNTLLEVNYPTGAQARDHLEFLTADPPLAAQSVGLGVDFTPTDATDGGPGARIAEVLPTGAGPQRIDFSVGLAVDADLPKAFTPPQVAARTRPAESTTDELGVLKRLRIVQVTCETVALALQDEAVDPVAVAAEADEDELRLMTELVTVRTRAKQQLDALIDAIERRLRDEQRAGSPSWKIMADPDYRRLHDLTTQRDRLDALLMGSARP